MFFFGERVAYAWSVLMPRNTAQRARLTVEDKSLLRVYGKAAAAEPYRNFVCFLSVLQKLRCKRVKIRVLSAVPQMRVFDFYNRLSVGRIDALFAHGLFIRVRHDKTNGAVLRICDPRGYIDSCGQAGYLRGYHNSRRAVKLKVKVAFIDSDNRYVAVNSAVKRKVGNLRIHRVVRAVIGVNREYVFIRNFRNPYTECRISAVV